ncbi:MAG: hypothetical protein CVV33_07535 [Methanomicrobiales archaeon HGW-Methanomicrobiales-4]|nr:MAG: hypothetical protein CVV33_07535 [Methanomicrobiales archaeon HGW-Methanomicrobiales-4]
MRPAAETEDISSILHLSLNISGERYHEDKFSSLDPVAVVMPERRVICEDLRDAILADMIYL